MTCLWGAAIDASGRFEFGVHKLLELMNLLGGANRKIWKNGSFWISSHFATEVSEVVKGSSANFLRLQFLSETAVNLLSNSASLILFTVYIQERERQRRNYRGSF